MLVIGGNQSSGGFEVANSLIIDRASGAKITNTFGSTTNRRTFTVSLWTKKTNVSQEQNLVFAGDLSGSNPFFDFRFNSDQTVNWYQSDNSGSGAEFNLITNRKFTDPNAWYHIVMAVDTTQGTSSNRVKLYVNGVQQTSLSTATYPSQNFDTSFNVANYESQYGALRTSTPTYDGYICEVVLIDGQMLDPTSFGEFDSDNGVWRAIDVSGLTFGNNGYYLDFEDSSDLGQDVSGNNNDFTLTNIAATDQSTDSCTNNSAIMNILHEPFDGTYSEGNLKLTTASGQYSPTNSSIALTKGKWYAEVKYVSKSGSDNYALFGVSSSQTTSTSSYLGKLANDYGYYSQSGKYYTNNGAVTYGNSYDAGDIIGIYLDLDNNKLYFGKNGTVQNSGTGISITDPASTDQEHYFFSIGDYGGNTYNFQVNFGSPTFSISSGNADANGYGNFEYDPSSGTFDGASKDFYALNTKNLAEYG